MGWYRVIKTVKGHRYEYLQRSWREGKKVRTESGLALARRLAHVNSLAFALTWAAILHNLLREFAEAQGRAEAAIEIAGKHRMSAWASTRRT